MTKADIVNEIAKTTGIDKANVVETIEKFMDIVKDSLAHGENVYLRGFGSFIINKVRSEKTARNISKNTTIIIPELRDTGIQTGKGVHGRSKSSTHCTANTKFPRDLSTISLTLITLSNNAQRKERKGHKMATHKRKNV